MGYAGKGDMVLKLKKALYGTRQAARQWQLTLRNFLLSDEMGFSGSLHDPCLFSKRVSGKIILLGIYVDDIVVAHSDAKLFEEPGHTRYTTLYCQLGRSRLPSVEVEL